MEIIASADVCMMGMFVTFMEYVPPINPMAMCVASWLWMERATNLKVCLPTFGTVAATMEC